MYFHIRMPNLPLPNFRLPPKIPMVLVLRQRDLPEARGPMFEGSSPPPPP